MVSFENKSATIKQWNLVDKTWVLLLIIGILILFIQEQNATAGLSFLDMKEMTHLWKSDSISPFDAAAGRTKLQNMRLTLGGYGQPVAPYPCHHQSMKVNPNGCPLGWPESLLQFLFPSPGLQDQQVFVANQAGIHDPLSNLEFYKIGKLADLLYKLRTHDLSKLRNSRDFFLKTRDELLTIFEKNIKTAQDKEVKQCFRTFIQQQTNQQKNLASVCNHLDISLDSFINNFLHDFYRWNLELTHICPPSNPNIKANRYDEAYLKVSVIESFVNILLGTVLLSDDETLPEMALYAYFNEKATERKDVLDLLAVLEHSNTEATRLLLASPEAQRQWITQTFQKEEYNQWLNTNSGNNKSDITSGDASKLAALKQSLEKDGEEFLFFYTQAQMGFSTDLPMITPYGKATVTCPKTKQCPMGKFEHSDCGEHSLLYLMLLSTYDKITGNYEIKRWQDRIQKYKLKPYKRPGSTDDVITEFIKRGPVEGRPPQSADSPALAMSRPSAENCRPTTHNEWADLVVSKLNQKSNYPDTEKNGVMVVSEMKMIQYTKPHNDPIAEIRPSVDNVLNTFERILGDFDYPENHQFYLNQFDLNIRFDLNEFDPNTPLELGTWASQQIPLGTLSFLELLETTFRQENLDQIRGRYRKYKLERLVKLITPPDEKTPSWFANHAKNNELPEDLGDITFNFENISIQLVIQKDHYYLGKHFIPCNNSTRRLADSMIPILIHQAQVHKNPKLLNHLAPFLHSFEGFSQEKALIHALKAQPDLIYLFPLESEKNRIYAAMYILNNEIESLYPKAKVWLSSIQYEGLFYGRCIGSFFSEHLNNATSPRVKEVIHEIMNTIPYPLLYIAQDNRNTTLPMHFNEVNFFEFIRLGRLTQRELFQGDTIRPGFGGLYYRLKDIGFFCGKSKECFFRPEDEN